jgi:precorrin-8X/cobalt-precorrin-8 methylmutase
MSRSSSASAGGPGAQAPGSGSGQRLTRTVHPIEAESYRRMRAEVATDHLPPLTRAVVERVVHASADLDFVDDVVCDEAALRRGLDVLRAGAPVVADVRMVAAGITSVESRVALDHPDAAALAAGEGLTRSAAGMRLTAEEVGPGAVYVVGNAPTALLALIEAGAEPALVVGLPVGFVDAAESKQALRDAGLPSITNRSRKGGSTVAAAAVNALLYAQGADL